MPVSLRICQEGHANGLALNKDATQIAVAGRSLLKVFAIETDSFVEVCNLRTGKNQSLNFSSNDVAWSSLDSNILATAATNGVVAVWDLSKFGRQKQTIVYNEHERTAHTVTFHGSEPNVLISGSQDGTIKYFDTRLDKSVYTYFSNAESVRDIKFSPHMGNIFAAASENGSVQLWDLRRWEKSLQQFTAHSGPIYTCDWHPKQNWLATGSRDKQIKVWNMDGKATLENTIHTIAVVGRVKWRPEFTYQIASCALVTDYSIHVFDIRRPYIAFASFNEHTNVTTGIAWKANSHCLLSTSKDSTVYKHAFREAKRPSLKANSHAACSGRFGNISFVGKLKSLPQISVPTEYHAVESSQFAHQRSLINAEQFHLIQSGMCNFLLKPENIGYDEQDMALAVKESDSFVLCAKKLLLTGRKLADICDHNATVCERYGKHYATTLWDFIKLFYATNKFSKQQQTEHRSSFSNLKNGQSARRVTQVVNAIEWNDGASNCVGGSGGVGLGPGGNNVDHVGENGDLKTIATELESEGQISDTTGNCTQSVGPPPGSVVLSETQILTEITFDNFDLLLNGFIYMGPPNFSKVRSLPDTALHHDVQAARPQPDLNADNREKTPPLKVPCPLKVSNRPSLPTWEPHQFMADSIVLQSDVGDVQTALNILIAMGEARKLLPVDESLVEHWFVHYIDQLHRYQLWNEASLIINLAWPQTVRDMNQKSTTTHTNCGQCGRLLAGNTVGWYCQKCKSAESSKCCVCGLIVRGLYAWCRGCSHGGHLEHLRQYFTDHSKCPTCGHLCEYN